MGELVFPPSVLKVLNSVQFQPLGSYKTKGRCHLHGKFRGTRKMAPNPSLLKSTWQGEGESSLCFTNALTEASQEGD